MNAPEWEREQLARVGEKAIELLQIVFNDDFPELLVGAGLLVEQGIPALVKEIKRLRADLATYQAALLIQDPAMGPGSISFPPNIERTQFRSKERP